MAEGTREDGRGASVGGSLVFLGARGDGIAAFVEIDVVEHREDRSGFEGALLDPAREGFGAEVAPAAFHHETVPDLALFIGVRAAVLLGPRERGFGGRGMGGIGEDEGGEGVVADAKKREAAVIEAIAETGDVIGRELAGGAQVDLVDHAAEINEAADLEVGTAETGDVRHGLGNNL